MLRTIRSVFPHVAAGCALAAIALAPTAGAQPPERPEGDGPPAFRDPLRRALDANQDFELDAAEISKAPEAIKGLDANGDGTIDREELRPPMGPPPGGPDRGPGDRGFEGRPPRPGAGFDRPPPRDGEPPAGPPRPREGGRQGGDRPSPERFVERAKSFDGDGDGKLDETELRAFAESMAERMRGGGRGPGGPGGPPRDGAPRPERPRRPE